MAEKQPVKIRIATWIGKPPQPLSNHTTMEDNMLKGIALWAMGVPVVVIILLYMFVF